MANTDTILIYRLINTSDISSNAKLIAKSFFGLPGFNISGFSFFMDTEKGSFEYKNEKQIFSKMKPNKLPKTEHEAISAATAFIERANKLVQNDKAFIQQGIKPLFLNIKPTFARGVVNPIYLFVSYWEVVFRPFVKQTKNEKKEVPVLDVEVKIKIGNAGQVIGMETNWIPILSNEETQRLQQYDKQRSPINNIVVYKQDVKQRMLIPYYVN